jgi:hypothetical protein
MTNKWTNALPLSSTPPLTTPISTTSRYRTLLRPQTHYHPILPTFKPTGHRRSTPRHRRTSPRHGQRHRFRPTTPSHTRHSRTTKQKRIYPSPSSAGTTTSKPPIHTQQTRPPSSSLREHTDDEQNTLRRQFLFGHSYPPTRTAHGHLIIFDSRTATHDSDSTQMYPSDPDSEDDILGYWPAEHLPETPHAAITDEQFADWIDSQLPWNDFRRSIPAFKNMPPELCGPPIIHPPFPNY